MTARPTISAAKLSSRRYDRHGKILVNASVLAAMRAMQAQPVSAKVLKWRCVYSKIASANGVTDGQSQALSFSRDETARKASVTDNAGTRNVEVFAGKDELTFLETVGSAAREATTIDTSGKSVHSRHTLLHGLFAPSQSYGSCRRD